MTVYNSRYTTRFPTGTWRKSNSTNKWVKFCYRFEHTACNYCCLYALHQWRSPIIFANSWPQIHNPWKPPTKKEAVKTDEHLTSMPRLHLTTQNRKVIAWKRNAAQWSHNCIKFVNHETKVRFKYHVKTLTNSEWIYIIG